MITYVSNCALSSGAICLTVWLSISLACCVKFLWHLDVKKLRYRAKSDSTFVVSAEKWATNKERILSFVLNLVKHLPKRMKKVYGDDCLSSTRIHEYFKCFQEGRKAFEDDERSGRPRNVVNEENAENVREFIRKEPKSSLKYMESKLGISAASIYRILTENLGYIKVCAKFVPHTLKPHEEDLRIFDYYYYSTPYRRMT